MSQQNKQFCRRLINIKKINTSDENKQAKSTVTPNENKIIFQTFQASTRNVKGWSKYIGAERNLFLFASLAFLPLSFFSSDLLWLNPFFSRFRLHRLPIPQKLLLFFFNAEVCFWNKLSQIRNLDIFLEAFFWFLYICVCLENGFKLLSGFWYYQWYS